MSADRQVGRCADVEAGRLDALRACCVLGSQPEPAYDALVRIAARLLDVPVVLVSLVDVDRLWLKARVGLDDTQMPSEGTFCRAVVDTGQSLVVEDARLDPRFAGLAQVIQPPYVRAYAGAPIRSGNGDVLGSFCALDVRPRRFAPADLEVLADLALQVGQLLELRRREDDLGRELARRVATEDRLDDSEQRYRWLGDNAGDILSRHLPDGTCLYVSPALHRILGRDPGTGGPGASDGLHPQDPPAMAAAWSQVREGEAAQVLVRSQHARGHWVWLEISLTPVLDAAGTVAEVFSAARDVSTRVQAEQELAVAHRELADRQEFLAAVLDSTQAGIVACDPDGHLTLFNEVTRQWHGVQAQPDLDPNELAGTYDLYDTDGLTLLGSDRVPLLRALREGQVVDAEIVIAPRADEPAVRVLCQGRRLREGDRDIGAVVVMHDVTALREREQSLAEARDQALAGTRAKTAFLAAASHEIRTPLNGVLGTLELLGRGRLDDEQRRYVEVARSSGEALLGLLNDVLDLSKAETSRMVLDERPFCPQEVAADVVTALGALAERKGLSLVLEADARTTLVGDPDRLRQVLTNLVGNALKFSQRGEVRVLVACTASTPGRSSLRLTVHDGGAGIAPEDLRKLFEPFVQGAQGQRYGGTGLGLTISQQLVDLMNGSIGVRSELGRGSEFTVDVELAQAQEPVAVVSAALPATTPRRRADDRRRTVLVADDSDINRMLARAMLEGEGAIVVTVADGDEAVEAVRGRHFDLVLLDDVMPRVSGPDAARLIRALPGGLELRLLAFTAGSSGTAEQDRARFHDAGLDGVVRKPARSEDLRRALLDTA